MDYPHHSCKLRIGSPGPFGVIEMSGMFTILKVREELNGDADPGWYKHPPGTVAEAADGSTSLASPPASPVSWLSGSR